MARKVIRQSQRIVLDDDEPRPRRRKKESSFDRLIYALGAVTFVVILFYFLAHMK